MNHISSIVDRPALKFFFSTLTVVAFGCLFFLTFSRYEPGNILFSNDIAVSMAVGDLLLHGEAPLSGPPSHLGGRSIGPAYYYYVALGEILGGMDPWRTCVAFALMSLLCIAGFAVTLRFFLSGMTAVPGAAGFFFACSASQLIWIFRVPWHANYLVIPAMASLASGFLVIRNGIALLPLFVLCLSLLLQSSLSTIPFAAGLGAVVLLNLWLVPQKKKQTAPSFLERAIFRYGLLSATILSWLPTLLYEIWYPSNFARLINSGAVRKHSAGIESAASAFLQFISASFNSWREAIQVPAGHAAFALLLACSAILVVHYFYSSKPVARWNLAALIAPLAAYFPAMSALPSPLHDYYMRAAAVIPVFILGILTGHAAAILSGNCAAAAGGPGTRANRLLTNALKVCALSYTGAFLFCCVTCSCLTWRTTGGQPFGPYENLEHAIQIASIMHEQIQKDANSSPVREGPLRLFVRGDNHLRENAVFFILGREYYRFMQYRKYFKEMPSFSRYEKPLTRGALLACNAGVPEEFLTKDLVWKKKEEISLAGCSSCNGCRMYRLESSAIR